MLWIYLVDYTFTLRKIKHTFQVFVGLNIAMDMILNPYAQCNNLL